MASTLVSYVFCLVKFLFFIDFFLFVSHATTSFSLFRDRKSISQLAEEFFVFNYLSSNWLYSWCGFGSASATEPGLLCWYDAVVQDLWGFLKRD